MSGDGKTMSFIPNALNQIESFGITRKDYRIGMKRHKYFFLAFGKTDDVNAIKQIEILEHFDRAPQLAFSAVDDDQIGQNRK